MAKIKVAVLGASGYSGEELIRLLLRHENCDISIITSRQNAGARIGEVFPRFSNSELVFSAPDAGEIAKAAESLKKLDKNGDGKLTMEECMPPRQQGGQGQGGQGKGGPGQEGKGQGSQGAAGGAQRPQLEK